MPKKSKAEQVKLYRKAERVLKKHRTRLLRRKGVVGLSIGYREKDGKRTKEICLKIHVEQKVDPSELKPNQKIGPKLDGVPIDIVEKRTYKPLIDVQGGKSIQPKHPGGPGTLGLVVYTPGLKQPRLLTNAHVVIGEKAIDDIKPECEVLLKRRGDDPVVGNAMPSKLFLTELTDCALVKPKDGFEFLAGLPGVDGPLVPGVLTDMDVILETEVRKIGAKTGDTKGFVVSITEPFSHGDHSFSGQIAIAGIDGDFSDHGDSGAVVLKGNEVVGILHGKSDVSNLGVACHFDDAQGRLGVELNP